MATTTDQDSTREDLSWDDIEHVAAEVFTIWVGQPELRWAQDIWNRLSALGLTCYANDLERHEVILRLFGLGLLYQDFCACAWDEKSEPWFADWFHEAGLSAFRLGQIVGSDFFDELELPDEDLVETAVEMLSHQYRDEIASALLRSFRTTTELFASLYLSNVDDLSGRSWDDLDPIVIDELVNDVTLEKLKAFTWVDQGMPSSW